MIEITSIPILNDFMQRLNEITDQDIATSSRRLLPGEEGDVTIGVVESRTTRAIWALGHILGNLMALEMVNARMADDEQVEQSMNERVAMLDQLGDMAREVFWAQAKSDLGYWKKTDHITLRKVWVLIEHKSRMPSGLAQLFRGTIDAE